MGKLKMAKILAHDDIQAYKNNLLMQIVSNENIEKAIDSKSPKYVPGQGDTLIGENVLPMLRIPDIQKDTETMICVEVDIISEAKNRAFHRWRITIWVMSHRDHIMWREKGCSRIDYISDELRRLLQNDLGYGFGILNLTSNKVIQVNPKYTYRALEFMTFDLKQSLSVRHK